MRGIVAAVRGGPGSHYIRRTALADAAAKSAPLYLLVVVAPEAYDPLHSGEQRAIRAEMAWRELALARSSAAQLGLPDVQFNIQVRVGPLRETIAEVVKEVDAATVLLGTPRPAPDARFDAAAVEQLATDLRADLGVAVEVVPGDGQSPQPGR